MPQVEGQVALETPAAEKVPDAQSAMVASPVAEQADVMRLPALVCVQAVQDPAPALAA